MEAYSIVMTVFTFASFLLCWTAMAQKRREKGRLIWSDQLKPGRYKVLVKSPCETLAILECKEGYNLIGLRTCAGEIPDVNKTFQWKVKRLKGYETEAVLVEQGGLLPPE